MDTPGFLSRREFVARAGAGAVSLVAFGSACALDSMASEQRGDGRLKVRLPSPPKGKPATLAAPEPGTTQPLGLGTDRDGVLFLPPRTDASALPLLLLLHGAGGRGENQLRRLGDAPAAAGVAVLSPDSRGMTWDAIRGGYGPDVDFIDRALERAFTRAPIDPKRVAIGGFSDGATYAISLGLINGDVFSRVAAFSPGFVVPGPLHGKARMFISHGTNDQILPIDRCSRVIVPQLRQAGYDVTFREFTGGHEVPAAIATEAFAWLAKG